MGGKRPDRQAAKDRDLDKMSPRAAARAKGKAKATGREYPTSGQRERAKKRSGDK
jgi:hypothetical protein